MLMACPVIAGETGPTRRPTVGLVLGGGGALGFAHIGVLKSLEEQRIPIDYIGGTSMGSIVAGLYAIGMSPQEIEDVLLSLDWWDVLRDATPRDQLEFRQKEDDGRFFGLDIGIKRSGIAMSAGLASGQKFNNLLEMLALRVAGEEDFDEFPIPYRAVATDVEKGEMVVMSNGRVATAMRASMAVPGAFTPVLRDGRVLVDGGLVNNIPVDVVKAMGADIIIAVDVGKPSEAKQKDRADTLGDILGNTYAIMQRPKQLLQMEKAQVLIQPETGVFSASEFHRVGEIIPVGRVAADAAKPDLSRYAVSESEYMQFLVRQRQTLEKPAVVSKVTVTGSKRVNPRVLENRIFSEPGKPLAVDTVTRDLRRLYGMGELQQIQFHTVPGEDGTTELVYDVTEKPWGPTYLKLGLNLRTDFDNDAHWAVLLNLTRRSLNQRGAEWRNELQFGDRQRILTEFYQPVDTRGFFFVAPSVEFNDRIEDVYDGEDKIAEYDVQTVLGRFDLGVQLRHYAELRIGPTYGHGKAEVATGAEDLQEVDEDLGGLSVRLTSDRLDRSVFPRKGFRTHIDYRAMSEDMGGDRTYDRLYAYHKQFFSWNDHTINYALTGGSSLDTEIPEYDEFKLGGPFLFSGLADGQKRGPYLGVASLGYRYRLSRLSPSIGQATYLITRVDTGNVWEDSSDAGTDDIIWGGSVGIGADTIAGPILLGYGRAEGSYSSWYFSLGTSF